MTNIIEIEKLKHSYEEVKAVDEVSFCVKKNEMFGLVGPDGAGKTTIIRILCGLLNSSSGEAKLFSKNINDDKKNIQNRIGYLSQKFSLYGDLTIDENIEFFADIHNVKNFESRRDELLKFTRLIKFRRRLADKLSGGMKQKLALACALIHEPEIIFLDEPTTGVDPVSRRDFWKILSELIKGGLTVFMTTPYLDEAERCNRVALMNEGKIIALDTPVGIKKSINKKILELVCAPVRLANKIISEKLNYDIQMFGDRLNIVIDDYEIDIKKIESSLANSEVRILNKREITPSLENVFIHLIKNQAEK
ncbi:MAG: ABC transporter ATP-binding protein [Rhodothermaceae bacterium]